MLLKGQVLFTGDIIEIVGWDYLKKKLSRNNGL
jgi:hypothetical protein